jgi:hypothetical protein
MLRALQVLQQKHLFTVEVVDVDADEALVAQYDEFSAGAARLQRGCRPGTALPLFPE